MPQFRNSSRGSAWAAQWSQPVEPGEPSVIESPSAATRIRGLSRSGIGALRDLLRYPLLLLDDVVALTTIDDPFQARAFVTGIDREPMRLGAKLFVLLMRQRDALA